MGIRKDLQEIPDALRQMYEKGRPQYEALIRRASWGESPVFMLAGSGAYPAALAGAWTFESLLGVPAIAARAETFNAYTWRALGARSLVIALGGDDDISQAVKKAKGRGATVWAAATDSARPLAKMAAAVVDCFEGGSADDGARSIFCRHAAMLFLAVAAAKIRKAPAPVLSAQEEELEALPRHVEWVLNQISDAAAAFAREFRSLTKLLIIGGGAFHPVALQAASRLQQLSRIAARGCNLLDFHEGFCGAPCPGSGVLYLSSSRCGLKNCVHESVREIRREGKQKIFAVTDANDRQLTERVDAAVLLPVLTEAGGALIALAFLELVTFYTSQYAATGQARDWRGVKP